MCYYDGDFDQPTIYHEYDRIARKGHICYECARVISPKEKYRYVFAVYCGDVTQMKTCAHCLVGQDWMKKECGSFLHGHLSEEIREHAENYKKFDLYRFLIGMRRQWKNMKVMNLGV